MGLSEAPPGFILGSNAWTNDSNAFESLVESSADMTFEDRKRRIRAGNTDSYTDNNHSVKSWPLGQGLWGPKPPRQG